MKYAMNSIEFERVEVFGKPALFTDLRVDRATVPEGYHIYDVRGSDYDSGKLNTLEHHVYVNHAGTVIAFEPLLGGKQEYRKCSHKFNFLGDVCCGNEICVS